jgi:hypothetical protein
MAQWLGIGAVMIASVGTLGNEPVAATEISGA